MSLAGSRVGAVFTRRRGLGGHRGDNGAQGELTQWQRAARRLDVMCPPKAESATLWCKIVEPAAPADSPDAQQEARSA